MSELKDMTGGVTAAQGYRAAGVHCGIKGRKLDFALVVSDHPAAVAGVFTTNRIQAAPVRLCRERLAGGVARAFVVNSGSANACTGKQGEADALRMAELAADGIGAPVETVFVCSTGTIGKPLPVDKIAAGVKLAVPVLRPDGGGDAARAIMTTDTVEKQAAVEFELDGQVCRMGGMAKGSGMIEPNMATMLAFITTDAAVSPAFLQAALRSAADTSFNRISVDGDQSTNDTVLVMANGAAGNRPVDDRHPGRGVFMAALNQVCDTLARKIVLDGEGATKFVTVRVVGAASPEDARKAVRAIGRSFLVKTSWFGGDPNWGRIIDAVGYSGADVREACVDISFNGRPAVRGGLMADGFSLKDLEQVLALKAFEIEVNLNLGVAADWMWTCDCSEEYVRINSAYMT